MQCKNQAKKNVNHALLAKSVESQRAERVETHFKDDKNQAGRHKAEDDDDFNENPRVPQECRDEGGTEKQGRAQKAPTDVVQQGSGAEAGHGTCLEGGFRCAAMRAIWQEAVEQIKVKN